MHLVGILLRFRRKVILTSCLHVRRRLAFSKIDFGFVSIYIRKEEFKRNSIDLTCCLPQVLHRTRPDRKQRSGGPKPVRETGSWFSHTGKRQSLNGSGDSNHTNSFAPCFFSRFSLRIRRFMKRLSVSNW